MMKANLDGTNRTRIAAAGYSAGIFIDHSTSSLIWADNSTIQSSELDGYDDMQTIGGLLPDARPWRIAVHDGKLFWSDRMANTIQSSDPNGANVHTVYRGCGTMTIKHLTSVAMNVSSSRPSDCAGNQCNASIQALKWPW